MRRQPYLHWQASDCWCVFWLNPVKIYVCSNDVCIRGEKLSCAFGMPLFIRNLRPGDALTYSLPILFGDVRPSADDTVIQVHNKQSDAAATSWPVVDSKFKLLVELLPGENELELRYASDVTVFTLHLIPSKLTKFVRPIYICCKDDPGEFQGPDDQDRSPSSAVRRIALAARSVSDTCIEKNEKCQSTVFYHWVQFYVPVDCNGWPVWTLLKSLASETSVGYKAALFAWSCFRQTHNDGIYLTGMVSAIVSERLTGNNRIRWTNH